MNAIADFFIEIDRVSLIALLAWKSNSLDVGIKDSGVDDGVKTYLGQGATR